MLARGRQAVLAAIGLALAAVAARPEIANGLVARGDEVAASGNPARAQSYYRRALAIDSATSGALDRLAIEALMRGNGRAREEMIRRLRASLAARVDAPLLFDLALLQLESRRYGASAQTFRHLNAVAPTRLFAAAALVAERRANDDRR